jgi:hypothetical protein
MPDSPPAPRAGDVLDDLHVTSRKLVAIADLVGQAPDLGVVDRDGLGLLLCDLAREVDRATDRLRSN